MGISITIVILCILLVSATVGGLFEHCAAGISMVVIRPLLAVLAGVMATLHSPLAAAAPSNGESLSTVRIAPTPDDLTLLLFGIGVAGCAFAGMLLGKRLVRQYKRW